jgi:hypothetical protein
MLAPMLVQFELQIDIELALTHAYPNNKYIKTFAKKDMSASLHSHSVQFEQQIDIELAR